MQAPQMKTRKRNRDSESEKCKADLALLKAKVRSDIGKSASNLIDIAASGEFKKLLVRFYHDDTYEQRASKTQVLNEVMELARRGFFEDRRTDHSEIDRTVSYTWTLTEYGLLVSEPKQ